LCEALMAAPLHIQNKAQESHKNCRDILRQLANHDD